MCGERACVQGMKVQCRSGKGWRGTRQVLAVKRNKTSWNQLNLMNNLDPIGGSQSLFCLYSVNVLFFNRMENHMFVKTCKCYRNAIKHAQCIILW